MQAGTGIAEVISIVKFTRVEFTIEITSAAGRTKLKKVWTGALDFKCFLHVFFDLGSKIDENVAPGPIRDQIRTQTQQNLEKVAKKGLDFDQGTSVLEGIFDTFRDFVVGVFLTFFRDVPFSLLGAIWAPKAPERVPKGSQK